MRTFRNQKDVDRLVGEPGRQLDFHHATERALGLRISYGGRKTYYVRYRFERRQRRATIGHHPELALEEARRLCRAVLADVDRGKDPAAEKLKERRTRRSEIFEDVVGDYIEKYAKPNKRSWRETEATLERYFMAPWGKLSLRSIDKGMLRDLLDEIVSRGTPSAANQAFACVRAFFSWAIEHDRCSQSPCTNLRMPAKEKSRSRVLKDREIRAIWSAAEKFSYPFGVIVKLLFLTGQRRMEVAGVSRHELDLSEGTWTLPPWRTKSSREHLLPLPPLAIELLRTAPDLGEMMFPARGTGKRCVSGFSKWKAKLDDSSGVYDWVLHDIRRTVSTGLARLGTPLHVIRKIHNHADAIPGVARVYNHYDYVAEAREALFAWQQHLLRLVEQDQAVQDTQLDVRDGRLMLVAQS